MAQGARGRLCGARESRFANTQLNEIARYAVSSTGAEIANIDIEML